MNLIQILDCNTDIGSCCNDGALVGIIDVFRRIMDLFQIIVPIILLTMLAIQLAKLVINPDEKNGFKKITNRIMAAIIVFLLPVVVNIVLSIIPATENFQLSACWRSARNLNEIQKASASKYINNNEKKKTQLLGQISTGGSSNTASKAGQGSAKGQAIVNYAMMFVGKRYVWGGSWNGEIPYTGTDCSGFVQGVFKHNGISLSRTTSSQWADKSKYTLVSPNDIRAGDLVMYDGHVAILTGNGNEIVHAANSKAGIIVTKNYKYSSQAVKGIMRIKGVN